MKLIRMKKTMAGPIGVFTAGTTRTVSDESAAAFVTAGAAEILGHISDETTVDVLTPDRSSGTETAAVAGAPERAVQAKPVKKVSKR